MDIQLTPEAENRLEMIRRMDTVANGFVLGRMIGKHLVVEQFFPANFDEDTVDAVYRIVFERVGERLAGVFFNNREPFFNEWFLEDVMIHIDDREWRYEVCVSPPKRPVKER